MIVVRNLSATYDDHLVYSDVSMTVMAGEWVVIIGPNGAGKSTLLRSIAGLTDMPGSVSIDGRSINEISARKRAQKVAFVPQTPLLPPGMTVTDYILLGRTPYLSLLGTETKNDLRIASEMLGLLAVGDLARRDISTLSGGEAQRVVLARALAQEPQILLLDEPTSALDLGRQQETMQVIDDLRLDRNLTVVTTMHDLTLAGQFADRLLLLNGGGILAEGTPDEVLTSETISKHYGANVRVIRDSDGGVIVVPIRTQKTMRDMNRVL
ncbi:MAG: ABC transporter ATP-binding protein [Acidimicrobiia bacterium]|nr:ABC transporter ATP-binding protein [Acidimicrobiia bacterium]